MYKGIKLILLVMILFLGCTLTHLLYIRHQFQNMPLEVHTPLPIDTLSAVPSDSVEVFMGTFLGNASRNYYGDSIPPALEVIWKYAIGGGETNPTGRKVETWHGAGWTGQPLIVLENGTPFLIQGCYDHTLKKVDINTGQLVWEYAYDDVLKGTGTIWVDAHAKDPINRVLILQGARLGLNNTLYKDTIPSYRAISYFTGKEVWRLNVKKGPSFSRDVDGSALVFNDTAYIGLENGFFSILTPGINNLNPIGPYFYKPLLHEYPMFKAEDMIKHGGELVIESSPCKIGHHIYVTTGSGHIYGYNLLEKKIDWDLYLGADMNGSPVVTNDSCFIVTLEKQFIEGNGGAIKINPSKPPAQSVVWYFPTGNREFASWHGGIVGSVSVNDFYKTYFTRSLACISALDGNLYLVDHKKINDTLTVTGPDNFTQYPTPVLLSTASIGPSISTPIFINNRICAASYTGLYTFDIVKNYQLKQVAMHKDIFESTPTAYHGMVFIASKNGYLYCFGKNAEVINQPTNLGFVQ